MSEFKAKTEYRKIPVKIKCPHCESEQNAHIEITPLFGSYVHVCGNCNYVIGESEWNQIEEVNLESVISHYNELLHIYTTTRAELDTVKAELDRGKWISVSERLPEINIDVLGFLNDRYIRHEIEIVRLTEAGKFYKPFKEIEITHWQPLPTPPHKN